MQSEILTANQAAIELTQFAMPFIGALLMLVIVLWFKDYATKIARGLSFSMNKQFQEGDKVVLDGEKALIVKIGLTQTVFGIEKGGDYVWRYVPNERIPYLKLEKVVIEGQSIINAAGVDRNKRDIESIKNGKP